MDPSVAVTPLYFGSMAWEQRALKAACRGRRPERGRLPGARHAYQLGHGCAQPHHAALMAASASYAIPFRTGTGLGCSGRIGRMVVGVAVVAAVATTVADRVATKADRATDAGRRARARARKVAEVGGVVAIAAGGVALAATAVRSPAPSGCGRREVAATWATESCHGPSRWCGGTSPTT